MKKKALTIYTVTSTDDCDNGTDHCVIGSWRTRGRALDECVDYIFERLDCRDDLALAMSEDENHPDAAKFFCDNEDGERVVKDEAGLREYLRDELGGSSCYYIYGWGDEADKVLETFTEPHWYDIIEYRKFEDYNLH